MKKKGGGEKIIIPNGGHWGFNWQLTLIPLCMNNHKTTFFDTLMLNDFELQRGKKKQSQTEKDAKTTGMHKCVSVKTVAPPHSCRSCIFLCPCIFWRCLYEPVATIPVDRIPKGGTKNLLYHCTLEGTSKLQDITMCDYYCKGWARDGETAVRVLSERPATLASEKYD